MANIIDETGNRHGKLFVLGKSNKVTVNGASWVCECACGNFSIVLAYSLRSGHTKSCGCLRGDVQRIEPGQSKINKVFRGYRNNARLHGRIFEIQKDVFCEMINKNCFYCGVEPLPRNGLDRKDNNSGYTMDNVVTCCETCNRAKLQMSENEFLNWIERVYKYSISNY